MTTKPQHIGLVLTAALMIGGCTVGDGSDIAPKGGSTEWFWLGVEENLEKGNYPKLLENLDALTGEESEFQNRSILMRGVVLTGLAQGHMALADTFRKGIAASDKAAPTLRNPLQQAHRDARQYAIKFVESLGDVEKAIGEGAVALDFPLASGSAAVPSTFTAVEEGEVVAGPQMSLMIDQALRRGLILAATDLGGFGEDSAKATTAFEAGGVEISNDDARMGIAKTLLDLSVLFDRDRINQPDIRKILIDRSEQWSQPFLEAEDEELKKRAEEFQDEIADERRDVDRKARRLKKRG